MIKDPTYKLDVALRDDSKQFVIVDKEDRLHVASGWLQFMTRAGRSQNTVKGYGSRIAEYLSWTGLTADWRAVSLSHLALWRRLVETTPYEKSRGKLAIRTAKTVNLWITPLHSFYQWADAEGLLVSDVANRMTQLKYFAPGTGAGGEHGVRRRVLVDELRVNDDSERQEIPAWIDDAAARQRLISLKLPSRDRFLIDLLYDTGIRIGEALSLFTDDLHFGGGSRALNCNEADPHFHVRVGNPTENGALAKGPARLMYVSDRLVESYIDYILERRSLAEDDKSRHVFVNLYSRGASRGLAMSYHGAKKLIRRCSGKINFAMSGPHILRHTFATRLLHGIDCEPQALDVVQLLMGHASIESTRVYTHATESIKKAAMHSVAVRRLSLKVGE